MSEQPLDRRGVASSGRGIGQDYEWPGERFQPHLLGTGKMIVEGGAADPGLGGHVSGPDAPPSPLEDEPVERVDDRGPSPFRTACRRLVHDPPPDNMRLVSGRASESLFAEASTGNNHPRNRESMMEANGRIGGATLIAAGAGTVLAMAHHPTGVHGGGALGPAVHAGMIIFLALTTFGFATFCALRGAARPLVLAGLVAYAIALFGHVGAGTINGFVIPALAARGEALASRDTFLLAWEANQALARLGVIAASAAFLFWSGDLLRGADRTAKAIGILGLAAGAIPPVLLLGGFVAMDVPGALLVYAIQAGWGAGVGFQMLRERTAISATERG